MRILCLFFCCMAWSITGSAVTAYADTTICDTIITVNPRDTILVRTFVDVGEHFYYIPCGESKENYITVWRNNVIYVGSSRMSKSHYEEQQRIALKKLKMMSLFNLLVFGCIITGIFVWYQLIIVGLLLTMPLFVSAMNTRQYLKPKYHLTKERAMARNLYRFPFIGFSILAIILIFRRLL